MSLKGGDFMTSNDEAQDGETHKRDGEFGGDISKENGDMAEFDSLAEAVFKLQSALEALENEVQLTRELGEESQKIIDEEVHEASSSSIYTLRENTEVSLNCLKKHVYTIKQDVDISKSKLEEANTELESEEIEAEIEDLFKHKLEAELQYLVISKIVDKLKSNVVDQVSLSDELESTSKVARDAQRNVSMQKRQAEELKTRIEDNIDTRQVSNFEKGIGQVASCLFIQLVLLILAFVSFVFHSSPHNTGVVPT